MSHLCSFWDEAPVPTGTRRLHVVIYSTRQTRFFTNLPCNPSPPDMQQLLSHDLLNYISLILLASPLGTCVLICMFILLSTSAPKSLHRARFSFLRPLSSSQFPRSSRSFSSRKQLLEILGRHLPTPSGLHSLLNSDHHVSLTSTFMPGRIAAVA